MGPKTESNNSFKCTSLLNYVKDQVWRTSQNDTHNLSKGSNVLSHMKNQKWNYPPLFTIILSFLIASLFSIIEVLIFLYVLSYCLASFHFTSRIILSISGRAGQGRR